MHDIVFRPPVAEDGMSVFKLVENCSPLDTNSVYCNLLQCTHFSDTSVAAVHDGELIGFISAYLIPGRPDTLFIWQVAVAESARGQGLGTRMLRSILKRSQCLHVVYLETTITESNRASWALFESLAKKLKAPIKTAEMFNQDKHFNGEHDSETLLRLGPFNQRILISANKESNCENI